MKKLNIGIIKRFYLLIFIFSGFFAGRSEVNDNTKEKIMEIKLDDNFIFGEGVSDNKEIAYGVALDDLLIFANEIKERNSQDKLSLNDLVTNVETLIYEDGSRFEVIVYIPFKIVIDTNHKNSSAKDEIKKSSASAQTTPVKKEKIVAAEKQNTEEISVKAKGKNMPMEKAEEKISVSVNTGEPPVAEISAEPPMAVGTKEPETAMDYRSQSGPIEIGEVEEFLVSQDNFAEIKTFLSDMKNSGKIRETGAAYSSDYLPQDASLILMDELGGILSILSPVSKDGRFNYKTHKTDTENNYNSKFILWYRK